MSLSALRNLRILKLVPSGSPRDGSRSRARIAAPLLAAGLLAALGPAPLGPAHAAQPAAQARSESTRVLSWTGGDRLWVGVDADVRYVQGPADRVEISGPRKLVDGITVHDGVIAYERKDWWRWLGWWGWGPDPFGHVRITVTAPHLDAVGVGGSGRLDLGRLSQDRLDLTVSGSGSATAAGAVRSLNLNLSGSGGVRLAALKATDMRAALSGSGWVNASGACDSLQLWVSGSGGVDMSAMSLNDADASLSGSGWAKLAPRRSADLHVMGSGNVELVTEPARLTMQTFGSGRVVHASRS